MYAKEIELPLVIRTPMGAGRGYGPTHSQSLEKFFLGIYGLNVYALNTIFPIQNAYLCVSLLFSVEGGMLKLMVCLLQYLEHHSNIKM